MLCAPFQFHVDTKQAKVQILRPGPCPAPGNVEIRCVWNHHQIYLAQRSTHNFWLVTTFRSKNRRSRLHRSVTLFSVITRWSFLRPGAQASYGSTAQESHSRQLKTRLARLVAVLILTYERRSRDGSSSTCAAADGGLGGAGLHHQPGGGVPGVRLRRGRAHHGRPPSSAACWRRWAWTSRRRRRARCWPATASSAWRSSWT
jgi:hypothetical protein